MMDQMILSKNCHWNTAIIVKDTYPMEKYSRWKEYFELKWLHSMFGQKLTYMVVSIRIMNKFFNCKQTNILILYTKGEHFYYQHALKGKISEKIFLPI